MDKQEYGDKYQDHLFEQYKLFVDSADKVSQRRVQINQFYISLLSGFLAILGFFIEKKVSVNYNDILIIFTSIMGFCLIYIWHRNLHAYQQLNSGKFDVILKMEDKLPFKCYADEWIHLGEGKDPKIYIGLGKVEKMVPIILAIPYTILLIIGIILFIQRFQ